MSHYGDFNSKDPNFEMHEEVSADGMRRTFTRGRPITKEGERILREQKAVYDSAFPEHFEEHKPRKKQAIMTRLLFGRDS